MKTLMLRKPDRSSRPVRFSHCVLLVFSLALAGARVSAAPIRTDFTGWHWPLPAGEWVISRGPCNSPLATDHQCHYYEDECALDFTSARGTMEGVPVLAPQAGQVFFIGHRTDAGNALLLRHPDGRVSVFMHLSRIVVGLDQKVTQGQVVAYAGSTGSSGNPHLHFFIQPNAVERQCLDLPGLDSLDLKLGTATSRNLAWEQLTLPDPPTVPEHLVAARRGEVKPGALSLPQQLLLAPGAVLRFPLGVSNPLSATLNFRAGQQTLPLARRLGNYSLFNFSFAAPPTLGAYSQNFQIQLAASPAQIATLNYTVRPSAVITTLGSLLISPAFVQPTSYSTTITTPLLCWSLPASAGRAPFQYRAMLVGPHPTESGWITNTCWQPPALTAGTYYWKVFVRDARGFMNRTNQRPYAFVIK